MSDGIALKEEFRRDMETYRARIEDLVSRLNNATTLEQLLRLDVEWQNILSELFSRSREYYGCNPHAEGYLECGLGARLREDIMLTEEAMDDAAFRISGKFDMEELPAVEEDEEYFRITKLQQRTVEEMASAGLKDDLDVGGIREIEFAQDVEYYRPKIEDFQKRIWNAKTVEELLRLYNEHSNLTDRMRLKSHIYYWSNRYHGRYSRRSLLYELRRENRSTHKASDYAAHRITGKRDFEDLIFGDGGEEIRKLWKKISDETMSAERKRHLAWRHKRRMEMEEAEKAEDAQTGA
jgi:hypothetical protein